MRWLRALNESGGRRAFKFHSHRWRWQHQQEDTMWEWRQSQQGNSIASTLPGALFNSLKRLRKWIICLSLFVASTRRMTGRIACQSSMATCAGRRQTSTSPPCRPATSCSMEWSTIPQVSLLMLLICLNFQASDIGGFARPNERKRQRADEIVAKMIKMRASRSLTTNSLTNASPFCGAKFNYQAAHRKRRCCRIYF